MHSCSTDESILQNDSNIKTVTKKQAIEFLQQNPLSVSGSKTSKSTTLSNYESITQEKIANSDQLLTVIPLPENSKQQNSRVLLLTANDTLKSVVFTMYPDVNQTGKEYSGRVIITNLNGQFNKGFRVKNGIIISKFILNSAASSTMKISDKSTSSNLTDPIELQEVVIPARNPTKSLTVSYLYVYSWQIEDPTSSDYNWDFGGGGGGGGASEPVVEEEDFAEKIVDTSLNACLKTILVDLKTLDKGKIAEIIKTFTGSSPGYNWEVKSDATKSLSTTGSTSSIYNSVTNSVTSTFHPFSFQNATDLSWARTIMHEGCMLI
jgi:hypothetical protein